MKSKAFQSKFYHLLTTLSAIVWFFLSFIAPLKADTSLFSFRSGPIYSQAKIFLVAGSGQTANFGQEILDQKRIWIKSGFYEEEIVCYYVTPTEQELRKDREQFLKVAPLLSDCYPASVSLLRKHLHLIGRGQEKPPFLYLYFTSHGERPLSYRLAKARSAGQEKKLLAEKSRYPVLNQYLLRIDGLPEEGAAPFSELLAAYRDGVDPEELFLTPLYLRNLLEASFREVPKFLVLQGCYTGGFVEDPSSPFNELGLKALSSLTLLTAARHDRASFGCEPGVVTTYFGGIFNEVFESQSADPRRMDWKTLYETVKEKVKAREREEGRRPPSEPVFFSNFSTPTPPPRSIFSLTPSSSFDDQK